MAGRAAAQRRGAVIAVIAALLVLGVVIWAAVASSAGTVAPVPSAGAPASPSAGVDPSAGAGPSTDPAADPSTAPSTDPSASADPAAAPPASPAATPMPAASTAAPPASDAPIPQEAPPVAPEEVAERAGIEVELIEVEHVDGQAIAPGEIAGPAIRLTVEVRNGTDAPVDAGLIRVNASYGPARAPAASLMQPGGVPFEGTIEPGEAARGVVLFEAGGVDLADTLIGVDVVTGQPTFTFRGDLR